MIISIKTKHISYQRYSNFSPKNKKSGKKILNIGITILIYFINILLVFKKIISAFFVLVLWRPLSFIGRIIFYKIVVRAYSSYLTTLKKLGWKGFQKDGMAFLFSQKLVHLVVVFITVSLVFINLTSNNRAQAYADKAQQTILADLIKGEFSDFEEDEQLIVETFDREAVITPLQQSYLDNLTTVRPQPKVSYKNEAGEEETVETDSGIVKPDITSTQITKRTRKDIIDYTIQPGDTISTIAEKFEVSVSSILWENDLSTYSIIRPCDVLRILPVSGVVHKVVSGENLSSIATKYNVEPEKILEFNEIADASNLQINDRLIIPGGTKTTYKAYEPKTYTGYSAIKDIVKGEDAEPVAGNKMNWPTDGHIITQYYSWRHTGLDIANKLGTPLYAADAGTIEVAGWGTGYGNQILINHGGGKKTRYAHLSEFFVEKGDKVSKGQTIGAMGSTGWSTGPHLHFEVIIDGKKYNPLNYIK